jgi:hypothetical protein
LPKTAGKQPKATVNWQKLLQWGGFLSAQKWSMPNPKGSRGHSVVECESSKRPREAELEGKRPGGQGSQSESKSTSKLQQSATSVNFYKTRSVN